MLSNTEGGKISEKIPGDLAPLLEKLAEYFFGIQSVVEASGDPRAAHELFEVLVALHELGQNFWEKFLKILRKNFFLVLKNFFPQEGPKKWDIE